MAKLDKIIVLMGPQGAGKGTQARLLAKTLGIPHISTGDLLREIARIDDDLGRQVKKVLQAGDLVSDEILAEVMRKATDSAECENGYLLDGYPRNLAQAENLELLARDQHKTIVVIDIVVNPETLLNRLSGRRTCKQCGAIYNINSRQPKSDLTCDLDGAPLFQRSDDLPEAIEHRMELYMAQTAPLFDYYRATGRLFEVNGERDVQVVLNELREIVG